MKKLNKKGFTLIELLAVIVIMGILMMVAIPAMSKVIENSRKDTFVETAQTYANAVSTLWYADGLECTIPNVDPSKAVTYVASAAPAGDYYIGINSNDSYKGNFPALIERGGKSSWGNNPLEGFVKVHVDSDGDSANFYVSLTDGIHGIPVDSLPLAEKLTRKNVELDMKTGNKNDDVKIFKTDGKLQTANSKNVCVER